jgi:1,4-alpha-glucan branching enzyme
MPTDMVNKKISPKGRTVRVTFSVPKEVAEESVAVVGDFNGWNARQHVMTLDKKNGVWKKSITFEPGTRLEFRYFADGTQWLNDDTADEFVPNGYLSQNCVVEL